MDNTFDAIVIGLGAAGSAAAYHLSRRGARVLGLDRFAPPHTWGSSHGQSRIIRRTYFEGDAYLPLLQRAYALWRDLEEETGAELLHVTGGLMIGAEDSEVYDGSRQSAERFGIDHEVLSAEAVQRRFPAFNLPEGHHALWEPGAGLLRPETCVRAHLGAARYRGANLHFEEPATAWQPEGEGVRVTTARGTYRAAHLMVCAGGWTNDLLPALSLPLEIERQVNVWIAPRPPAAHFTPERCPIYIWEYAPDRVLYGFPDLGEGAKAGLHHGGDRTSHPDALRREVTEDDLAALRAPLRRLLPTLAGPARRTAICFYTLTPDAHYLIDRHPAHRCVLFASPCSGHGFKASCAIGEALAEKALDGASGLDLSPFCATRLGGVKRDA